MTRDGFVIRALDVPFKRWGRDYDGWDCWGLVYVAYRDVEGTMLPSYAGTYRDAGETSVGRRHIDELIRGNLNPWERAARPQPWDVALFRVGGLPIHVALYLGNDQVLHTEKGANTFVERLSSPMWNSRLEGVYRYVG